MSKQNPTSGPWKLAGNDKTEIVIYYDDDGHDAILCENVESMASAHLVAAAPDLLKACEWVSEAEWGNAHEKTLEIVCAAIAKARGE